MPTPEIPANSAQAADAEKAGDVKQPDVNSGGDDFKSDYSKSSVLADLSNLRNENKAMKQQIDSLLPFQRQMEGLSKLLLPEEQAPDPMATVDAALERLAQAEHRALVAEHGTGLSEDDKQILSKITDAELMASVAKRLRDASAEQPGVPRRNLPRSDRSAGAGIGEKPSGSVAAGKSLYQEMHGKK